VNACSLQNKVDEHFKSVITGVDVLLLNLWYVKGRATRTSFVKTVNWGAVHLEEIVATEETDTAVAGPELEITHTVADKRARKSDFESPFLSLSSKTMKRERERERKRERLQVVTPWTSL
jgi:hypothetical protein